tara:strand:- start:1561 stop:3270 length:1710 start_codon:yes stop_codon:yes gene_type:complete
VYKIKQFIGEYQSEINTFFNNNHNRLLVDSKTGTGKTTSILSYADSNPSKRIALLCPFRALVDSIGENNSAIKSKCGYGVEFINRTQSSNFIVTTYDSILRLTGIDIFIVDEAHLLAGHSSFREVIPEILKTESKVIFLSGTPEIIEDLFPHHNRDKYVMSFDVKRPKKGVRLFSGTYNVRNTISSIITSNVKSDKTILIRVNSKKVIDDTINAFKYRLKDKKIACFYSDEKNVIYKNQEANIIDNLKKGVIKDVDIILCTSVYDVGISFSVDKDIEAYAVSEDNRKMPNAIDMIQFIARVRANSGYTMDLTIIGRYGTFSNTSIPLPNYDSKEELCNEMAHRYDKYSNLSLEAYNGLLEFYDIRVTELADLKLKRSNIRVASRVSDTDIATNFHNFTKEYNIVLSKLKDMSQDKQIALITGTNSVFSSENNMQVQRVFNILLDSATKGIDFDLFIENGKFYAKRYAAISSMFDSYQLTSTHTFSNLIRGMSYVLDATGEQVFEYKEIGLNRLNKANSNTIKTIYNMMYSRANFRGARATKKLNKNSNLGLIKLVNHLATCNGLSRLCA